MTSSVSTTTLSLGAAARHIAWISFKTLQRGKLVWVASAVALLPILVVQGSSPESMWKPMLSTVITLALILAPLLVAGSIGEEVEKKTLAYLWSRPIPRAALLFGKLLAFVPFLFGLLAAAVLLCYAHGVGRGAPPLNLGQVLGGLLWTVVLYSVASAALATFFPKYASTFAIVYLLVVDSTLSAMPTNLRYLSLGFQAHVAVGHPEIMPRIDDPSSVWIASVVCVVFFLAIALRRSRRAE